MENSKDPFLPKRNVARSVDSGKVFNYIMDCLKTTCLYFGIPQLKKGALFGTIHLPLREYQEDLMSIVETHNYITSRFIKIIMMLDDCFSYPKEDSEESSLGTSESASSLLKPQAVENSKHSLTIDFDNANTNKSLDLDLFGPTTQTPHASVASDFESVPVTDDICLIIADMEVVIDKYKKDKNVAFAHCISADFYCNKQMSQGVAVRFREVFGRPKESDYCDEYITCQGNNNEAVVYGLVTKPRYFMKPKQEIYDRAFDQLTQNFKIRGLHTLICSPLGCVRDRIHPNHFAAEIVKFQRITGASVRIVTFDESSKNNLRRGATHSEFLNNLIESISLEARQTLDDGQREYLTDTLRQSEEFYCDMVA